MSSNSEIMILNKKPITAAGKIFSIEVDGKEIARGRLYIMRNDLHEEPFAFVEDLFVEEKFRNNGYGSRLLREMVEEAEINGCYKIVACSREERKIIHKFYEKNGFEKSGYEFRMNLK